ncbi:Cell division inhibitor SulA [Alteromonadaceae bacterium Bs31]|nr:Cell division inhibitor SulA [Alteromonadaceae bacterium Bs31]
MANLALNPAPEKAQGNSKPGITEIHVSHSKPGESTHRQEVILPMLAHLSKQSKLRWFTWIAPQGITKALLQAYGFELNNVQLVHPKSAADIRWLMWEALNSGTSETVVASTSDLTAADVNELEKASFNGSCRGLLLQ